MAAERTFKLRFVGDQESAERAFKGAGKAADDFGSKVGGVGSALGGMAKIAGGFVLGAGILKAPGFLMDAARAAADDEAATMRLHKALENVVQSKFPNSIETQKDILADWTDGADDAIAAGQKLAFSDDDIRDSLQGLLVATGDFNEASKRQKAAMDLARGANIPLATASKMLGKINEENVEVFKKLGITIGENATEADALAAVQAKFGGQADAYAKSTAGQFAQAKLAMGEVIEGIGGAVLPILTKVGTLLAANLPAIQAFVGGLGEKVAAVVVPALARAGTAVGIVAGWVRDQLVPALRGIFENDIQPKLDALRGVFEAIAPKVQELAATLAEKLLPPLQTVGAFIAEHKEIWAAAAIVIGGVLVGAFVAWAVAAGAAAVATIIAIAPVLAIGLALTALVAGIIWLVKNWDDLEKKYPALQTATENVKAAFEAFVDWIKDPFIPTVQAIATTITDVVTKAVGFVRDHWGEIMAVIQPALDALAAYVKLIWDVIQVYIETTINVIKGILDVVMGLLTGDWQRAWDGVTQIVFAVWEGIKGVVSAGITFIKELAPLMLAAGQAIGGALKDGIVGALKDALELAGGIANALVELFENAINWVIDKVNDAIPNKISVPHLPDINLPDNPVGHVTIPRFAQGTSFFGGGLALVGEQGPELVGLPRGSQVIPARETASMLGGGAVALNATFNIQGNADEGVLRTALERWWREKLAHEFGPGALQWGVR